MNDMIKEEWDIEKAISYFEIKAARLESDNFGQRPNQYARIGEKRLYDIGIANINFYKECAQNCYNMNALKNFLLNPTIEYLKTIASDDYFDVSLYEKSLYECRDEEIKNIMVDGEINIQKLRF